MTVITLYCLFGDDVRQIGFNATSDPVFYVLTIISFFAFSIEIIISCIVQEDYWLGFYFWLDIISTISLVADVGWIMDAIAGVNSAQGSGSNVQQATKLARAGRGARIGTKAARLARIIRLIRLLRIVKLYKSANYALNQLDEDTKKNQVAVDPANSVGPGSALGTHKDESVPQLPGTQPPNGIQILEPPHDMNADTAFKDMHFDAQSNADYR